MGRKHDRRRTFHFGCTLIVILSIGQARAIKDGQSLTPPMGWNSFNQFGGDWTDANIKANADSMITTGLANLGYNYCNIDGHNDGVRYWPGGNGQFVTWAKPLGDYIHAKGLKFGVYMTTTTNATATAADCKAANVDYLKHDDWTQPSSNSIFAEVRDALAATGRPIIYSMHASDEVIKPELAHVIRTCWDIAADWTKVMDAFDATYTSLPQSGPGGWADPDMLEVGCAKSAGEWVLSEDENRAHFSMWCMIAAPLLIGYDLSRTRESVKGTWDHHLKTLAILSNSELIAIDQDSLGKSGRRLKGAQAKEVWVKELKDGTKAVALFNRTAAATSMTISATEMGFGTAQTIWVRDLWKHQDMPTITGTGTITMTVNSHAAEIFRVGTFDFDPAPILNRMGKAVDYLARNGYYVFPRKTVLTVMQGIHPQARAFDLRGRAISVNPVLAGKGVMMVKPSSDDYRPMRMIWTGSEK